MKWMSVAAAMLLGGTAVAAAAPTGNWIANVEETDNGHAIGNPDADHTLIEFVSYTCPHCGDFARNGDEILKLAFVAPGSLRLEIRNMARNPVDKAIILLTSCGADDRFVLNHAAFMHQQPTWLAKARTMSKTQQDRWFGTDWPISARAIASDLDFYAIMESRGYSRVEADQCLVDSGRAAELDALSRRDAEEFGITGTPSFVLDGELLEGVHSWPQLERVLMSRE